jgi:hypothetical protein
MRLLFLQLLRREVGLDIQLLNISQILLVPAVVQEQKIRIRLLGLMLHPDPPRPALRLTLLVLSGNFLPLSPFSLLTLLTIPLLLSPILLLPATSVSPESAPELLVILLFLMFRLVLMLESLKFLLLLLCLSLLRARWIVLISSLVLLRDLILVVELRGVEVELFRRDQRGLRV